MKDIIHTIIVYLIISGLYLCRLDKEFAEEGNAMVQLSSTYGAKNNAVIFFIEEYGELAKLAMSLDIICISSATELY